MTTAVIDDERNFAMGNEQIQMFFEELKQIRKNQEDQNKVMVEVKLAMNTLEIKTDNLAEKLENLNCTEHADTLKKASDFMLVHDANEKTLFGIRSGVIAWLGFFMSFAVGIIAIYKFLHS